MDEGLARELRRRLIGLRRWLVLLSLLWLLTVGLLGYIAWRAVSFSQQAETKITKLQQTADRKLDFKAQFCKRPYKNLTIQQLCE